MGPLLRKTVMPGVAHLVGDIRGLEHGLAGNAAGPSAISADPGFLHHGYGQSQLTGEPSGGQPGRPAADNYQVVIVTLIFHRRERRDFLILLWAILAYSAVNYSKPGGVRETPRASSHHWDAPRSLPSS